MARCFTPPPLRGLQIGSLPVDPEAEFNQDYADHVKAGEEFHEQYGGDGEGYLYGGYRSRRALQGEVCQCGPRAPGSRYGMSPHCPLSAYCVSNASVPATSLQARAHTVRATHAHTHTDERTSATTRPSLSPYR